MVVAAVNWLVSIPTLSSPFHSEGPHPHNLSSKFKSFAALYASEPNPPTSNSTRLCECYGVHGKLVPYALAESWQKSIVREKKALIQKNEDCPDSPIVLQHHPVYTLGTGSSQDNLNFDLKDAPFDVYRTERGGEVTYHGPGQLVMYPIINLRNHKMDLHWYLRALEEVVIRVLSFTFAIKASRLDGFTGVWVGDQKLAAVGIRVSQWIAYHGLALNVTTDLTPFNWIVPCGIRNCKVGSIKGFLPEHGALDRYSAANVHQPDDSQLIDITHKSLLTEFSEIFQLEVHYKSIPDFGVFGYETTRLTHLPRKQVCIG